VRVTETEREREKEKEKEGENERERWSTRLLACVEMHVHQDRIAELIYVECVLYL
jgi:hypothetical protein